MGAFAKQCDTIAEPADQTQTDPSASRARHPQLHRMAGVGGTLGFPRVSVKAAELEDALRASPVSSVELRDGIAALHGAFSLDAAEPPPEWASPQPQGSAMTVLVVEDERVQRTMIAALLRKAGHVPVLVESGEEALAAVRQDTARTSSCWTWNCRE